MPQQAPSLVVDTTKIDPKSYNVIGAAVIAELSPFHKRIVSQVTISSDPADQEVYLQKRARSRDEHGNWVTTGPQLYSLTKPALVKLADMAGVKWDYKASGRIKPSICEYCSAAGPACLQCKHHHTVAYRAVGAFQDTTGAWRSLIGTAEVDLSEREPDEAGRMASHLVRHTESRAFNAAIRNLGIKQAYSKEELARPFLVSRTYFDGSSDPNFRALMFLQNISTRADIFGDEITEAQRQIAATAGKVMRVFNPASPNVAELLDKPDEPPPPDAPPQQGLPAEGETSQDHYDQETQEEQDDQPALFPEAAAPAQPRPVASSIVPPASGITVTIGNRSIAIPSPKDDSRGALLTVALELHGAMYGANGFAKQNHLKKRWNVSGLSQLSTEQIGQEIAQCTARLVASNGLEELVEDA